MWACKKGHIDIARMLLGEYHAHIDIQNRVSLVLVVGNVLVVADICSIVCI